MSKCQKLWSIWFITYLIVINCYLTVMAIKDYLDFKYQMLDPAYGGKWEMSSIYIILGCLNVSLALLPIIIYMVIMPQGNLANDGHSLGRDCDVFHLTVDEHGEGHIVPTVNKKSFCFKSPRFKLIYMELPPFSYMLHTISAMCFLLPKSLMEAHRIHNKVIKSNHVWHSDLDFIFDPDEQHSDFYLIRNDRYIQPVSVAYFNLGLSLILLSLQYSKVLWYISRKFTLLLSFIMVMWTVHVLLECSSVAVMIKISVNRLIVNEQLRITLNPSTIQFLSISSNIIFLFSFTTVFHYGILQYADTMIHKNRKFRRQMLNSSPQMIGSNQLDIPRPFSPSVSENNYSDSSIEPVFSKSHFPHILAVSCLFLSASLKFANIYQSFVHLYRTTSDSLVIVNVLISCLFMVTWMIIWFAFALRRSWNFKIKADVKFNVDTLFLNGNSVPNHSGPIQLHQNSSLLRNTKSSEINLSKHDMMVLNRNIGLDGCSDDTDMSSKLSSNNYVFLQSMRNGQLGLLDANGQPPMLRNPLYLSYALNNQGLQNNNIIYANDDSINNRSVQLDDMLGSEHSYNSCRSRNAGFENMPPVLPNFGILSDENRYKNLIPNSVAMEKLIPRYLRSTSVDYNNLVHFPMASNDFGLPTVTSPTMSYTYDTVTQNFNNNVARYKQFVGSNQIRPCDKYSTLQTKSSVEHMEFLLHNSDEDIQRRSIYNGDNISKGSFDPRRAVKSPIVFPTLEENVIDNMPIESECLLPDYSKNITHDLIDPDSLQQPNESNNNNESGPLADRMCSQV